MSNFGSATLCPFELGFDALTDVRASAKRRLVGTATTVPSESNDVSIYIKGVTRPPKWFEMALEALNTLSALPAGWNSYAARQIDVAVVKDTMDLLAAVMDERSTKLPTILPVPSGGVLLEWQTLDKDLEVIVRPTGRVSVLYEGTGEAPVESELLTQEAYMPVRELLRKI